MKILNRIMTLVLIIGLLMLAIGIVNFTLAYLHNDTASGADSLSVVIFSLPLVVSSLITKLFKLFAS